MEKLLAKATSETGKFVKKEEEEWKSFEFTVAIAWSFALAFWIKMKPDFSTKEKSGDENFFFLLFYITKKKNWRVLKTPGLFCKTQMTVLNGWHTCCMGKLRLNSLVLIIPCCSDESSKCMPLALTLNKKNLFFFLMNEVFSQFCTYEVAYMIFPFVEVDFMILTIKKKSLIF